MLRLIARPVLRNMRTERQLHVAECEGCARWYFSFSRHSKAIDECSVRRGEVQNEPVHTLSDEGGVECGHTLVDYSHVIVLTAADGGDWPVDPKFSSPQQAVGQSGEGGGRF